MGRVLPSTSCQKCEFALTLIYRKINNNNNNNLELEHYTLFITFMHS